MLTDEQLHELIHALRGTALSMTSALEQMGHGDVELSSEQCQTLDEEIFECELCGWWCERSKESETIPEVCNDCEL